MFLQCQYSGSVGLPLASGCPPPPPSLSWQDTAQPITAIFMGGGVYFLWGNFGSSSLKCIMFPSPATTKLVTTLQHISGKDNLI